MLELWAAKNKAVLCIKHDLEDSIAIDLPRPRHVAEVRTQPRFVELHTQIWGALRDKAFKGYALQLKKVA